MRPRTHCRDLVWALVCPCFVPTTERMIAPKTLSQYPWVVVRIECKLCSHRGAYRLARLAARYGPEFPLEGLIEDLANNFPYWHDN